MVKKKKNNITVIVIVIVSIVIVGGVLTWGFLTNWGQGKKSEPVKYTVPKKIPKGTIKIEIENPESYGFKIGQEIEIGTGETRERRTIVGFGSLILDKPLKYEHPANTVITVVAEPNKKDFKVDNCHEYTVDLMCKVCRDSYYLEDNKCKKYSYTGTQDECNNKNKGIFTKGTSSSDQTCKECEDKENQWVNTDKQECTEYKTVDDCEDGEWFNSDTKGPTSDATCQTYTHNDGNCKVEDRKILTKGTSSTSDDSNCTQCTSEQWINNNQCVDYTYTKANCKSEDHKNLIAGTSITENNSQCLSYSVIESRDVLNKLLDTPSKGGYIVYGDEYVLDGKNYGPMKYFSIGFDDLSGLFKGSFSTGRNIKNNRDAWKTGLYEERGKRVGAKNHITTPSNRVLQEPATGDHALYYVWSYGRIIAGPFYLNQIQQYNNFNKDISGWDVSNVTKMNHMFMGSKFNGNISKWDVSNVTDMQYMFAQSDFNGDISEWNVSNVTNMKHMFSPADGWSYSGKTSFNGDISKWDVSNVTNMENMFYGATFTGDISKWDVSNVTNMKMMFFQAKSFNGDINTKSATRNSLSYTAWDVSNVTNMENMFNTATKFNKDISEWNVSNVTNMKQMFFQATAFNKPLNDWDISSGTSTLRMFKSSGMKECNKPGKTRCSS